MKKRDYRKIMKEERHICYRNAWHLGCATCYFVMIILVTTLLVFFNALPIKPFIVVYVMAAVFIAIPTIVFDQLNDKQMREGMQYYEKHKKTKPGIDYTAYIKTIEFVAMMLLIISMITIYFRFLRYDYREVLLGDLTTIRTSEVRINNAFNIYIPEGFKSVKKELKYAPEDTEYSITYNKDGVYIGIYFTNINISDAELYNYVSSLEYYYTEKENDDVDVLQNTISMIYDDNYYYMSYYSYKDKIVQITYSCDKDDIIKWNQGFTTINNNIEFLD